MKNVDMHSSPGSLWKTFDQGLIRDRLLHPAQGQENLSHLEDFLDAYAAEPLPPTIRHLKGAFIGWGGWLRRLALLPAVAIYLPLQASDYLGWSFSRTVPVALSIWAAAAFVPSLYNRVILSVRYGIIASDVFYDFRRSLKPLLRTIKLNRDYGESTNRARLGMLAAPQVVSFQRRLDSLGQAVNRNPLRTGSHVPSLVQGAPQELAPNSVYRPDFVPMVQSSSQVPAAYQMFQEGTVPYDLLRMVSVDGLMENFKFDLILYYLIGLVAGFYLDFSFLSVVFVFSPFVALLCLCGVRVKELFYSNPWWHGVRGQDPSGAVFNIKGIGLLRAYWRELRPVVVAFRKGRATDRDLEAAYVLFMARYPLTSSKFPSRSI